MKKAMYIMLIVVLTLALSTAVYARYEVCPQCNGRMIEWEDEQRTYSFCEKTNTLDDTLVIEYGVLECTNCDYSEWWEIDQYIICRH